MWERKKRTPQKRIDSLIGFGTVVYGNVAFTGGLRIDGHVQGNVVATDGEPATLVISEQGENRWRNKGVARGRQRHRQRSGNGR
jgi:cytoskeletal protein CcmA (bactofilin family)